MSPVNSFKHAHGDKTISEEGDENVSHPSIVFVAYNQYRSGGPSAAEGVPKAEMPQTMSITR